MATITTRASKGSPLTSTEMDTNLENLNNDKTEKTKANTHGAFLYLPASSTTTISATGTYYKLLGTTTSGGSNGDIDTTVNNRIKYTGADTKFFTVDVAMSLSTPSNSQTIGVKIAINGVVQDYSEMELFMKTSNENFNMNLNVFAQITQDDYIEVFIANKTSTANVTVDFLHFRASSVYTN